MTDLLLQIISFAIVLVSLGAGTASILLSNNLSKEYNLNYLKSLFYNNVLTTIFGIYGLLGTLFIKMVLDDLNISKQIAETIILILPFLGFPFLVTAWYMFIKVSREITGGTLSKAFTIGYFVFQVVFFLSSWLVLLKNYGLDGPRWEITTTALKFSFLFLFSIAYMYSYYLLYFKGSRLKSMVQRKEVLYFGHINLIVQLFAIFLFLKSENNIIISAIFLIIFFGGGIPAVLFLKSYLNKNSVSIQSHDYDQGSILTYLTKQEVSKRESEIIEKICEGMTNQQVADALFISLQTVKDHAHNIYIKLGVKNRVQMVNLMRNISITSKEGENINLG